MTREETAEVALLRRRAAALARPVAEVSAATQAYLAFVVQNERYALPAGRVRHVVRDLLVSPLPGARPPLVGVAAWHARLLPAFTLSAPHDIAFETPHAAVIIGDAAPRALIVDALAGLVELTADDIHALSATAGAHHAAADAVTTDATMILDATSLMKYWDEVTK